MSALQLIQSVIGHGAVVVGVLLFCIAAIGLLRFRDPYSRLAATTKSGTLGVCLVLLGVLVLEPSWSHALILLLAVALQIMTAPVGGFALGRAAFRSDAPMPDRILFDELHEHLAQEKAAEQARAERDAGRDAERSTAPRADA
ncbi:MAG: monovalent cation/H(+) antiporter subunit G [Actinotalea sp.]|nr:monovalent cation/H(+) antiporter subunit G [Actinotalea sp.]